MACIPQPATNDFHRGCAGGNSVNKYPSINLASTVSSAIQVPADFRNEMGQNLSTRGGRNQMVEERTAWLSGRPLAATSKMLLQCNVSRRSTHVNGPNVTHGRYSSNQIVGYCGGRNALAFWEDFCFEQIPLSNTSWLPLRVVDCHERAIYIKVLRYL